MSDPGGRARLLTLEDMVGRGKAAINASLSGCVRFLESGRWLNVYEMLRLDPKTGSGAVFRQALRKKLGEWYGPRRKFERLLRLSQESHYAAINIGGGGPDYGPCCIHIDNSPFLTFATAFSGDPLRVIFDTGGKQRMSDAQIMSRFATFSDRAVLAAVHSEQDLLRSTVLDEDSVIAILENRETLIEVHIHGEVNISHAVEITMRKSFAASLERRAIDDYEHASREERKARRFDDVRTFKRLLQLADQHGLRLKQVRG